MSNLKYTWLAWMSKPAGDRALFRAIRKNRVTSIVELGVGMGVRAHRMLAVAERYADGATIRYTGVDLFEARDAENPGLTLKRAHRLLSRDKVRVQVVPGDPFTALARIANSHRETQMIVIAADQDRESLDRAWMYVPRMLTADSIVFLEEEDEKTRKLKFRQMSAEEIDGVAGKSSQSRRRAA